MSDDATMRAMRLAIEYRIEHDPNRANVQAWESVRELAGEYEVGYEFFEALIAAGYAELWGIANMPIPWQNVMRDQVEGMGYGRWGRTEPTRRTSALGHTVEHDPPFGLTSADRWTCTACGHAVLKYNDNVYGSAVDRACQPVST